MSNLFKVDKDSPIRVSIKPKEDIYQVEICNYTDDDLILSFESAVDMQASLKYIQASVDAELNRISEQN